MERRGFRSSVLIDGGPFRSSPRPAGLLARNVRLLRRERGMSQEALADATRLWQAHVSEIERGKRNVSLDNIGAVAHALGVSVARLFQE